MKKFKESVGKTFNILTEKNSFGYSENYLKVKVNNSEHINEGEIYPVKITGYEDNYLQGKF